MQKIILASSSPRRKQLLSNIVEIFEVISPKYDESKYHLKAKPSSIEKLSLLKAKSISVNLSVSAFVISADTVVICDNEIMGKPKNRQEAYRMLKTLSGNTHKVITGVALIDTDLKKEMTASAVTYVTFNQLSDDDIWNYIDTKQPFDKAGSYGIQELPKNFIRSLKGEIDNVIGLPTKILINMFKIIK